MTREEFRRKMMAERYTDGQSVADAIVELCLDMQILMHEVDHRKILRMPSTTFDLLYGQLAKRRSGR